MRLSKSLIQQITEQDVAVGNLYPAQGGKKDSTDVWLVVALTEHGAHLLGFNKEGRISSTASYLRSGLKTRPVLGKVDLSKLVLTN